MVALRFSIESTIGGSPSNPGPRAFEVCGRVPRISTMTAYLGIDAGGTRTRWVVLEGDAERALAAGEGPAIQAAAMGVEEASSRLRAVLMRALSETGAQPAMAVAGIAGAGDGDVRSRLEQEGRAVDLRLRVTGDPEVAAAVSLRDGPGVAVWSGTGSFAVGRDGGGALVRVGGHGPWLGDEGSAFDLVRRAAAAAVRAADGLSPVTELGVSLAGHFGVTAVSGLGGDLMRRPVSEIAAALPVVTECASAGDAVALDVLQGGARELVGLAQAVADRLGVALPMLPVTLGGGVLDHCAPVRDAAAEALSELGFAEVRAAPRPSAHGAAFLARALHEDISPLCDWVGDGVA